MESLFVNFGILVLRIGIGALMILHGFQKLKIILTGEANKWLDPIGIGASTSLYLACFAEFFCSAMILFGLFTRISALILAWTMFVAAFVFLKNSAWSEKELAVVFFVGFVSLFFLGGGEFSLSKIIFADSSILGKL